VGPHTHQRCRRYFELFFTNINLMFFHKIPVINKKDMFNLLYYSILFNNYISGCPPSPITAISFSPDSLRQESKSWYTMVQFNKVLFLSGYHQIRESWSLWSDPISEKHRSRILPLPVDLYRYLPNYEEIIRIVFNTDTEMCPPV
jgi:hypothetical protein